MPVLAVRDEATRDELRAAFAAAGLSWSVELHRDLTGDEDVVFTDTPVVRPELRKKLRHDVRTPLAVMLGQADLLELEPLTARQQRCVDTLRTHCERLEAMLTNIASEVTP
ncbi:MAG: hypothetical protein EP330_20950 [Deltaproteobacteria bacterium]|nr:MAG: hypothetical protein EP330_20950 [Deltaproteobacteria bacterium]